VSGAFIRASHHLTTAFETAPSRRLLDTHPADLPRSSP
jgi:hypothetical protein